MRNVNVSGTGSTYAYHTYNQDPAGPSGPIYVMPLPSGTPSDWDLEHNPVPYSIDGSNQSWLLELENSSQAPSYSGCPVGEYRSLDLAHAVAMDTATYFGDTIMSRFWSRWTLYQASKNDSLLQADSLVMAFADTMRATVYGILDSINGAMHWGINDSVAGLLQDRIKTLTVSDSIGSLWKEVNDLAIASILKMDTAYGETEIAQLEAIGALCPQQHGPAVYIARALLTGIDNRPRLFINECEDIYLPPAPSERRGDESLVLEQSVNFTLFPNPNTGLFTVTTDSDSLTYNLVLRDLAGRTIRTFSLTSRTTTIDISELSQGTYIGLIQDHRKRTRYVERVIISK